MTPEVNRSNPYLSSESRADFNDAYRKRFWQSVKAWLTQHTNELLPFDEVRKVLPMYGQHYVGLMQVHLDQIVGSVSRYNDFDRAFLPRQTHTRERWETIDRFHLNDVILPPVELYKIGDIYFVKDGNHRISVAREKGQVFIDAYVIEIDVPVDLKPDLVLQDLVLKREQAIFNKETRIMDLRPDARIEFSIPNQYSKLMEHIRVHRYYMGERRNREIGEEDAIKSWYDHVYIPLVRIIRNRNILEKFPDRKEADLYLWIIEHRYYLMAEYRRGVSLEKAALDFAENFSQRPLRKRIKVLWLRFVRLFKKRKK
jgi:hypothetical protein